MGKDAEFPLAPETFMNILQGALLCPFLMIYVPDVSHQHMTQFKMLQSFSAHTPSATIVTKMPLMRVLFGAGYQKRAMG